MIDDVERYKNTTKQIQCHNEKIIESFRACRHLRDSQISRRVIHEKPH